MSAPDGAYWKGIRQATAPCFSFSNLKQVVYVCVSECAGKLLHVRYTLMCEFTGQSSRFDLKE